MGHVKPELAPFNNKLRPQFVVPAPAPDTTKTCDRRFLFQGPRYKNTGHALCSLGYPCVMHRYTVHIIRTHIAVLAVVLISKSGAFAPAPLLC